MLRTRVLISAVVLALLALTAPVSAGAVTAVYLVEGDTPPDNVDAAVAVVDATLQQAVRVLIARDDAFADALASGVLQGGSPLLFVPTAGPVPQQVTARITALGATEAVVLGGSAAVSDGVVAELQGMGLAVQRRAGASRIETAVAIAQADAPAAGTILLARAFGSPDGADPSQGFADTLAAGGVAARTGFPILMTETATLTAATRDYLAASPATRVLVLGGTAAISDAAMAEVAALGKQVERVAGPSRAETAIAIAGIEGDASALDARRVIVTEGQSPDAWAFGFALASHAAAFDAPIVLTSGGTIPPATQAFLAGGVGGDPAAGPQLTCAVARSVCDQAVAVAQGAGGAAGLPADTLVYTHNGGLHTLDTTTGTSALLHQVEGVFVIGPQDLSPDRDEVLYLGSTNMGRERSLYAVGSDGTDSRVVLEAFGEYTGVREGRWSPDGTQLAASLDIQGANNDFCTDLWVFDAAGGDGRLVYAPGTVIVGFDWTSDGSALVVAPIAPTGYNRCEEGPTGLYRVDAASGAAEYVGLQGVSPDIGADDRIAYIDRTGAGDVFIAPLSGQERTQVTTDGLSVRPSWSPDGTLLAVERREGGGPSGIGVVPATGGAVQEHDPHGAGTPVW